MKQEINIIIPLYKNDFTFNKEFLTHKYLTKVNDKKNLLEFTLNSINQLTKNFTINTFFILNEKDKSLHSIVKSISKKFLKFNKKIIKIGSSQNIIKTCLKAKKNIQEKYPTIIFHPDSYSIIDSKKLSEIIKLDYQGIIMGYEGFNPIESAGLNTDRFSLKKNKFVKNIFIKCKAEKELINTAGLFYFKSFKLFENYSNHVLSKKKYKLKTTSEVFQELLFNKINIVYFKINLFINFSNINAVNEFLFWKKYFTQKIKYPQKKMKANNIIPAAGLGIRHKNLYNKHKPFIEIDKKPMINWSIKSLPRSDNNFFIFHEKVSKIYKSEIKLLKKNIQNLNIYNLKRKTKGMAITCLKLSKVIDKKLPLFISSCDYSFLYDEKKFQKLLKKKPDAIIFTFRKYPDARIDPNSYAYVKVKNEKILKVSEKKTISQTPQNDYSVVGTFYFKDWNTFDFSVKKMVEAKNTVNNEYYVATAINQLIDRKYKVYNFEVSDFISWSLPHHTLTYFYWFNIYKKIKINLIQ